MIIDKVEYKNYQEWHKGRTTPASLVTLDYEYKGGKILVTPNPYKRAVDINISYRGLHFDKTFDVPCDIVWRERRYGICGSKVKYEKEYRWRDIETIKLAEEFAKSMLDGLDLLSKRESRKEIAEDFIPIKAFVEPQIPNTVEPLTADKMFPEFADE